MENIIAPDYVNSMEWREYCRKLELEYKQSFEEGLDIEQYKDLFISASKMPNCKEKDDIADALFSIVSKAKIRVGYQYNEPSDLEGIQALRDGFEIEGEAPQGDKLKKKIEGAWVGRICGCLLGKPVEGARQHDLVPLLKETGNYPMHRYILRSEITDEMIEKYDHYLGGVNYIDVLDSAPIDDDTNYTVMSQLIVEKHGRDFTSQNVGDMWLSTQPICNYFTAERIAFKNLVNGYSAPASAMYKNPYREWIGAQIRGDYFGYINPANPEVAADMAWRDARISHIKNGIYGEMWASAMISCAAVTNNIMNIIKGGLGQIPKTSRLYEEICDVMGDFNNGIDFDTVITKIHKKYDEYSDHGWCHTISNAKIVAAALLYGGGDYGKSVCMAVQSGFDTDCNGATVGSVLGMANGIDSIDSCWYAPLNGQLKTSILGHNELLISELVNKTFEHIK
ncbi:MAG: ADP-ribosylglycohydrolase family protein [Clostridia bacterium]|nr:ADP-ribosylglycohydrolase family protein [Clostridia bacterium]